MHLLIMVLSKLKPGMRGALPRKDDADAASRPKHLGHRAKGSHSPPRGSLIVLVARHKEGL